MSGYSRSHSSVLPSLESQLASSGVMCGEVEDEIEIEQSPRRSSRNSSIHQSTRLQTAERCSSGFSLNAPESMENRPLYQGDVVCGYKLHEQLSKGKYCDVWVAHPTTKANVRQFRTVVVKTTRLSNKKAYDQSCREAELLASLDHPNIINCYEETTDVLHHCIVLEHVIGCDLYDRVRSPHFKQTDLFPYFYQIASGLCYAHRQGVTHRDLKPENIVVFEDGKTVKLIDFGLGSFCDEDDMECVALYQKLPIHASASTAFSPSPSYTPTSPTRALVYTNHEGKVKTLREADLSSPVPAQRRRERSLCGTEAYLSPEVKRQMKAYDPKSVDMWGLGAILYFMVYKRALFLRCERNHILPPFAFNPDRPLDDLLRGLLRESDSRIGMGELQWYPYWTRNCAQFGYTRIIDRSAAVGFLTTSGLAEPESEEESHEGQPFNFCVPSAMSEPNIWENPWIARALHVEPTVSHKTTTSRRATTALMRTVRKFRSPKSKK